MHRTLYRFSFPTAVPVEQLEELVVLALIAAESLHGTTQTRLGAGHFLDRERRQLVIEAHTEVGQDFCKLFTGFATGELGPAAFQVERLPDVQLAAAPPAPVAGGAR